MLSLANKEKYDIKEPLIKLAIILKLVFWNTLLLN